MVAARNEAWTRAETSIHEGGFDSYPVVPVTRDEDWQDEAPEARGPATPPPVSFHLDPAPGGTASARAPLVTTAAGQVRHVDEERLELGTPGFRAPQASLAYHLPASIDLRLLVGRRVELIVRRGRSGPLRGDTLTIRGAGRAGGPVWLVAHHGGSPLWQNVDGVDLSITACPEQEGLLVVAPPGPPCVVAVGASAPIVCGRARLVAELLSLEPRAAAYVIVDERLWH